MDLTLTQGWSGLALAYTAVQGPMLAGLVRGRAEAHKFLTSPILAVPLTAVAGVGMAAAAPLLAGLGVAQHGLIQFGLSTAVSVAIGYAGGRAAAQAESDPKIHQRGAVVTDASGPLSAAQGSRSRGRQITLAGTAIPLADETKHFKLIGTTGTGKSTAIQEILQTALERGDRAVIADPDGGYLRRFYDAGRGDVVLNPFDERSVKWDLFAEIENAYDVDQLSRSLIPDHDGADRSWRSYARTFFSAVTRQAHEGGIKDLSELYRLLVVADTNELRTLVKGTPAQPFLNEHNSRMFDSIRSVTSSAVGAIDYIAQQNAPQFSIREWVKRASPGVLFIPYNAGQIAALRSTISGWMRLAIFEAMNHEEQPDEREPEHSRRLWFVVDELDALGQIDGLKDALARLRKFGGRCVLGFQSIAQVSSTYGQGDAHTIVENCGNTLILRCSASEGGGTARFASQLIGEREVLRSTVSTSRRYTEFLGSVSRSEHFSVEPAVLPSQIEQLSDLSGYLKHASDPKWHRVRLAAVRQWNERFERQSCADPDTRGRDTRRDHVQREGSAHE
jgi:type IV secretory pathway TraG/TraD family ATPase VirD4